MMAASVRTNCILLLALVAILPSLALAPAMAKGEPELGAPEVKMGAEGAAAVAKDYKLGDNAADLKRIRDIGAKIAEVANRIEIKSVYGSPKVTPFEYTFSLIEDKDVNAFSLPGGHIYVYRGLLDFVQSDQELAGVIAHEVIHASHHHMVYLLKKQASLNNQMAIAVLAAILGGARSADLGNVVLGVQVYQTAILNGYGQQAERDSDYGAVILTRDAGYNPVGLLTFLERLARRPELVDYGIYRSHPIDSDRVKAAKECITTLGLPINRRDTTNAIKAEVKVEQISGADVSGVTMDGQLILRAAPVGQKTSAQRAAEIADIINKTLDSGVQMHDIKLDASATGVLVRDKPIVVVTDADAGLTGKSATLIAQAAAKAIKDVVWKQMVDTLH